MTCVHVSELSATKAVSFLKLGDNLQPVARERLDTRVTENTASAVLLKCVTW